MGSCHELNFKLQNPFVPVSVDVFLKDISVVQDITDRWEKMNDYMQRLEDEMRKIDVFKRELPLSMVLLEDAIKTLKEKMNCFDRSTPSPVMKEFLPVASKICDDEDEGDDNSDFVTEENDCTDKINWKNSLQLWTRSDDNDHQDEANKDSKKNNLKQTEMDSSQAKTKINGNQKYVYGHGAFSPFKLTSSFQAIFRKENQNPMVPDLSLMSGCTENYMDESDSSNSKSETRVLLSSSSSSKSSLNTQSQQSLRKTRRCWSPDLHKRFLHALEQLGGAQVATPKQIRELMKVDGLTNDEVKSHLQKYRLHARRVPSSSKIENQQKMVLKGIWIPHENYPLNQRSTSKSRSPTSSLQLENDRKSESYSWKGYGKRSDEDVTQSLAGSSKFLQICAQ